MSDFVIENGVLIKYVGKEEDVVIPAHVRELGPGSFEKNKKIKKVFWESDGQEIDPGRRHRSVRSRAFALCSSLEYVEFFGNISFDLSPVFVNCKQLKIITLHETYHIHESFLGINKRTDIIIPIVAPNVGISTAYKPLKPLLAMGYILFPDSFPKKLKPGYEKYLSENKNILINLSKSHGHSDVLARLEPSSELSNTGLQVDEYKTLSLKEAAEEFYFTKKDSGYKIVSYFGKKRTVVVPNVIGQTAVKLIGSDAFSEEHIVKCRGELFLRLSIPTKIRTFEAYLQNEESFLNEQAEVMKNHFEKDAYKLAVKSLKDNDMKSAMYIIDKYPFSAKEYDELITLVADLGATDIQALLLNKRSHLDFTSDDLNLETDRLPVTLQDYKNIFKCTLKDNVVYIRGMKNKESRREFVTIPGSIEGYPVALSDNAFENDDFIKQLVILDGVREIGNCALQNCENLEEVVFPSSLNKIGAFLGKGSLFRNNKNFLIINGILVNVSSKICDEEIICPEGITCIHGSAFINCRNVVTIHFPIGTKVIEHYALSTPNGVKHIYLPDTIELIEFNGRDSSEKRCWEEVTIHAPAGGYVEKFAKKKNIPFVAE